MYATTEEEKRAFYQDALPGFLEYLRSHMKAIEQVELAVTREGIVSFPATQILGGVQKTVRVPISLLTAEFDTAISEVEDATDYANAQGDYAKAKGDYAEEQGDYAKDEGDYAKNQGDYGKAQGDYAKEKGDDAAEIYAAVTQWYNPFRDEVEGWYDDEVSAWNSFKSGVNNTLADWSDDEAARVAAEQLRVSQENTRQNQESTRQSQEQTRQSQEGVRQTQEQTRQHDTAEAISDCNSARDAALLQSVRAKAFNDNPWELRNDGFIWVWDETHDNGDGTFGAMTRTNKMIIAFGDLTEEQKQSMIDQFYASLVFVSAEAASAVWSDYVFTTTD